MAVNDVQAVAFCNTKVRPTCDSIVSAYRTAKEFIAQWNAQGISSIIPNDAGEVVFDGAESDGRPLMHGDDAYNVFNRASELVTDLEANNNAKLNTLLEIVVRGNPVI